MVIECGSLGILFRFFLPSLILQLTPFLILSENMSELIMHLI